MRASSLSVRRLSSRPDHPVLEGGCDDHYPAGQEATRIARNRSSRSADRTSSAARCPLSCAPWAVVKSKGCVASPRRTAGPRTAGPAAPSRSTAQAARNCRRHRWWPSGSMTWPRAGGWPMPRRFRTGQPTERTRTRSRRRAFLLQDEGSLAPEERLDDRPTVGADRVGGRPGVAQVAVRMRVRLERGVAPDLQEDLLVCARAAGRRPPRARARFRREVGSRRGQDRGAVETVRMVALARTVPARVMTATPSAVRSIPSTGVARRSATEDGRLAATSVP